MTMDKRVSNPMQAAYLRRYMLTSGKENGIRVIEVFNGRLRFLLNESKALDMMQLFDRDLNLSFLSKNGFMARELPFTKRFEGGMLYTVGLDSAGARDGYELHGSFHNLPADVTETVCNGDIIRVTANIADTELFGKNLLMRRTVTTKPGASEVEVRDTLVNCGTKPEDYCLLYHVNLGYPFLDEGVRIVSDAETAIPRTDWAKAHLAERTVFRAAKDNEEECCYFLRNKTPHVEAINEKLKKKFSLDYSGETLPRFLQWNSNATGDYALGLEPCTTDLDKGFTYCRIEPGASIDFHVKMTLEDL